MADINCPSGFLMSYDEETDQYIPFLMKTRDKEIIWYNDNENIKNMSSMETDKITRVFTSHPIENGSYYIPYRAKSNECIIKEGVFTPNETEPYNSILCKITRYFCNIASNINHIDGLYKMIIIDTLVYPGTTKTKIYTVSEFTDEMKIVQTSGIYNKPANSTEIITDTFLSSSSTDFSSSPQITTYTYQIKQDIGIDIIEAVLNIRNLIYCDIDKDEYDIIPNKKHVIEIPFNDIPVRCEISSDGTCDVYIKFLLSKMEATTNNLFENTETSVKSLTKAWTVPAYLRNITRFIGDGAIYDNNNTERYIRGFTILSSSLNIGSLSLSKMTSTINTHISSGSQIILYITNTIYPFSFTDGVIDDVDARDFVMVHLRGYVN